MQQTRWRVGKTQMRACAYDPKLMENRDFYVDAKWIKPVKPTKPQEVMPKSGGAPAVGSTRPSSTSSDFAEPLLQAQRSSGMDITETATTGEPATSTQPVTVDSDDMMTIAEMEEIAKLHLLPLDADPDIMVNSGADETSALPHSLPLDFLPEEAYDVLADELMQHESTSSPGGDALQRLDPKSSHYDGISQQLHGTDPLKEVSKLNEIVPPMSSFDFFRGFEFFADTAGPRSEGVDPPERLAIAAKERAARAASSCSADAKVCPTPTSPTDRKRKSQCQPNSKAKGIKAEGLNTNDFKAVAERGKGGRVSPTSGNVVFSWLSMNVCSRY